MAILNPGTKVGNLVADLAGRYESSRVTLNAADDGVLDVQTVTLPATASATQADYIVIYNKAGATEALWLDIDANGTAPSGAAYVAATTKTKVSISTGGTAADTGAAFQAAIALADVTAVDHLDGTVTITGNLLGAATLGVPKNANDSGAGSITVAHDATGHTSAYQSKYFTFRTGANAAYYVWFNNNTEGSDPAPGGTAAAVTMRAGDSLATIGAAIAAAINLVSGMDAVYEGPGIIRVTAVANANITDIGAGNAPVTVAVFHQGYSALDYPALATGSISNNPAAF